MKKDTKQVSKVGQGGFSLSKKQYTIGEIFPDFPTAPDYPEEENFETDGLIDMEFMRKIFLMCDENPPQLDNVWGRREYLCLVFESREQKNELLHEYDLYRLGDKYMEAEIFADAFGIDLAAGTITPKEATGHSFGKTTSTFSQSLSFGANNATFDFGVKRDKKEIDESLKETRAREKDLAKWMEWTGDPEYFLCLSFRNKEEKEGFQKAINAKAEYDDRYIWCHDFAKAVGATLVPCLFKNKNEYKGCDKKMADMIFHGD